MAQDAQTQNLIALLIELAADADLMARLKTDPNGLRSELVTTGITFSNQAWSALASGNAAGIRNALGEEFLNSFGHVLIGPGPVARKKGPKKS